MLEIQAGIGSQKQTIQTAPEFGTDFRVRAAVILDAHCHIRVSKAITPCVMKGTNMKVGSNCGARMNSAAAARDRALYGFILGSQFFFRIARPPIGDVLGDIAPRRGCPAKGGLKNDADTTSTIRPCEPTGSLRSAPVAAPAKRHLFPARREPEPAPPRSGRGLRSLRGNGPRSKVAGRSRRNTQQSR